MTEKIIGPPEFIEDEWKVFHRISGTGFNPRCNFVPAMIRQQGDDGVSTDWEKYTSISALQMIIKPQDDIISFSVGAVRALVLEQPANPNYLLVEHDPITDNYSHALIVRYVAGNKAIARNRLFGIARLELHQSSYSY